MIINNEYHDVWKMEDIRQVNHDLMGRKEKLSDKDCFDIMSLMERRYSSHDGINYMYIEAVINEFLENKDDV